MFKKITLSIAGFLSPLMFAASMASATSFVGGGILTDYTQACDPDDPYITSWESSMTMTFRPSELNAGRVSNMALQFTDGTLHFSRRGTFAPSRRFNAVDGAQMYDSQYTPYSLSPRIRVIKRMVTYPAGASLANAQSVYLEFLVRNHWGIRGCEVRVEAMLGQAPSSGAAVAVEDAVVDTEAATPLGRPGRD
ncbi:hypothetical protein LCM17_14235 [Cereibacter sphaeroides]|nr:hypothetical protein [Cereibacter sphaeroides]